MNNTLNPDTSRHTPKSKPLTSVFAPHGHALDHFDENLYLGIEN